MKKRRLPPLEIRGRVKMDKKTKNLAERLEPGDIALICHRDLDEMAADSLCKARVKAVINADSSLTGRYPNKGPQKLAGAGIVHLDQGGVRLFERLYEGDMLCLRGSSVFRGGVLMARCRQVSDALIARMMPEAGRNMTLLLDSFVQNTLEYAQREKELILGQLEFPSLQTSFGGRHTLVVVRGQSYREDLLAIRHYLEEVKPVLVGVDGGADALLEFGYVPHLVIGDMDSVSDEALRRAREIIVHAYPDGRCPGLERIRRLGLSAQVLSAPGTSEDIALLLAYEKGAGIIAAVGTHSNIIDFLEKGRKGMASTFLVRLKVGDRLVDARGISQLYRSGVSGRSLLVLAMAAAIPVVVLALTNPTVRHIFRLFLIRYGLL
jgi:uncharacterized membrane-anchored protein